MPRMGMRLFPVGTVRLRYEARCARCVPQVDVLLVSVHFGIEGYAQPIQTDTVVCVCGDQKPGLMW